MNQPRTMSAAEAGIWTCPITYCGQPATAGTIAWEARGPFQLVSTRTLYCPAGHTWRHDTDGS